MSGGHFNYAFYNLDTYSGEMEDAELNELLEDFQKLLHDLEGYKSGDYGPDEYKNTVNWFKKKWFKADRSERLERIIGVKVEELKTALMEMIGE